MNVEYFLDTNIFLYCFGKADLRKNAIATKLVEEAGEKA
jgi:predicted nucleic acid-binding protein